MGRSPERIPPNCGVPGNVPNQPYRDAGDGKCQQHARPEKGIRHCTSSGFRDGTGHHVRCGLHKVNEPQGLLLPNPIRTKG